MNIILMCGGDGSEHDISLKSADFIEEKLGEIQNVRVVRVVLHKKKWVLQDGTPCIPVGIKTLVTPSESIHMTTSFRASTATPERPATSSHSSKYSACRTWAADPRRAAYASTR